MVCYSILANNMLKNIRPGNQNEWQGRSSSANRCYSFCQDAEASTNIRGFWVWSLNNRKNLVCTDMKLNDPSAAAAAATKSLQSCPTLCDPIDGSPPGSPIPGILQARTLEWVAVSFSNAWKWKVKVKSFSRVRLLATSWTAAHQAPPSMGFSRQEYWSGVPLSSP